MIFFTSDLHLGHTNIITLGHGRPFDSIQQHDRQLIQNINDTVAATDELWILGDFALHAKAETIRSYAGKINCRSIHLVLGNHDRANECLAAGCFATVRDYVANLNGIVGDRANATKWRACLMHYPILDWDGIRRGTLMLHGHIHSLPAKKGQPPEGPDGTQHDHTLVGYNEWCRLHGIARYDVGVDANGYRPVSIQQILTFMGEGRMSF